MDEASTGDLSTEPRTNVLGWVDDELVTIERGSDYDFVADYEGLVNSLAGEFLPESRTLAAKVNELVDLLSVEFTDRYVSRRSPLDPPLYT